MIVTRGIENIKKIQNTAATLGSYDGVHLGHREIIKHLIQVGENHNASRTVLITFDPHPQEVLRKNNTSIQLLTTLDERIQLLNSTDIDEVIILSFTKELAVTPYHDFFRNILLDTIGISYLVVGFNHAFGKDREGDIAHLRILANTHKIFVDETPPFMIDGQNVSSTKIRQQLQSGNIETANSFLGRYYSIDGVVVKGNGWGREFGFPTANIHTPQNKLIPIDGIYAGRVEVDGKSFNGAISIGTRPTVTDSNQRVLEAHLLDFNGDLYGMIIRVHLHKYIRPQIKFSSKAALIKAIHHDIENIQEVLA